MLVTVIFPNFYSLSLNLASDLGVAVYGSFWQGTGRHKCNAETIPDEIIFKCATLSFPQFQFHFMHFRQVHSIVRVASEN